MMGGSFDTGVKAMSEDCWGRAKESAGIRRVTGPVLQKLQKARAGVSYSGCRVATGSAESRAVKSQSDVLPPQPASSPAFLNTEPALVSPHPRVIATLLFVLFTRAFIVRADVLSVAQANPADNPKQLKSLSLEQLGNVEVVTANKWPTELWHTPSAVYVITADDIRRSGATSIADALRLAPGVEVGRLSSTTWAVGIRGLENNFSKSVLVLIDGRNVYTPLFAGVYWDVQDLPLENIDRIEVIRGPGGTIWGPNAANGVINIITKKATETRGTMAAGLGGTLDHTIDTLQFGFVNGDLSYRFYGRGFQRGHEYHTDGINDDAWHQERFGFRTDLDKGRDTYFLEGMIYGGDSPHIVGTSVVVDQTFGRGREFALGTRKWQWDGLHPAELLRSHGAGGDGAERDAQHD